MAQFSRRHLVYLYPRAWRRRYGQEFALLLDAAPLSTRSVANICAAAGREWMIRTLTGRLVLGPTLAYIAFLVAQVLSVTVTADPTFSYEGGVRLVSPPWPVGLALLQPLLGFGVLARFGAGFIQRLPMGGWEFSGWLAALTIASTCWQWGQMVGHRGTGLDPQPLLQILGFSLVNVTSHLIMLLAGSRGMPSADKTPSPFTGSSRPLGLS